MRLSTLLPFALATTGIALADGVGGVTISEIRIDQDQNDDDEYFELEGSGSLDGLFYIVIGDGTAAAASSRASQT